MRTRDFLHRKVIAFSYYLFYFGFRGIIVNFEQSADSVSKAVNEVIDIDSLPKAKEKLKTQFYLGEFPENTGLNGFPCFSSGDVFIILDPRNPKYQYRLHRNILESFSSVFRRTLKEQVNEASQQMKIDAAGERALRYAFDYSLSPLRLKREVCLNIGS